MPPAVGDPADGGPVVQLFLQPPETFGNLQKQRFAVRHIHIRHDVHAGSKIQSSRFREAFQLGQAVRAACTVCLRQNDLFNQETVFGRTFQKAERPVQNGESPFQISLVVLQIDDIIMKTRHDIYGTFHCISSFPGNSIWNVCLYYT